MRAILEDVNDPEQLFDVGFEERLRLPVDETLDRSGLKRTDRTLRDVMFACNASLLRRHHFGDCRRLTDTSIPPAEGLKLPEHCFPDGIVYGVVADGMVASLAHAHRAGVMENVVADMGVTTAPAFRRRGYAKTAVSAVVEHITHNGGEARYGCRTKNSASIATALSVGFVPFGRSLVLSTPSPDSST